MQEKFEQTKLGQELNPLLTFDKFVITENNRVAA
jgi:chromosomal replication initiation ATPase DnaA